MKDEKETKEKEKEVEETTITILRLGHRTSRDKRVSTHLGLVARAFGADAILYCGEKDEKLVSSIKKVADSWGGNFSAEYCENPLKTIKEFKKNKGKTVHLTMYGEAHSSAVKKINKKNNLLIIVGGQKVPIEIYKESDYNISIGIQPHSEISALAIFLHDYFKGKELKRKFEGSKIVISPNPRGKAIKTVKKRTQSLKRKTNNC
ncbi:MAG: tRNA (cytidine(56)-2'-O)-methyltransferase [Candidatus Diapherotrites archaeon]|nr:tRNA (cytidine(56)-2'-O)-methyltransferase [Candidatus Diapherotrites archaeon]